jgi:Flp pilus assembly protein TadG
VTAAATTPTARPTAKSAGIHTRASRAENRTGSRPSGREACVNRRPCVREADRGTMVLELVLWTPVILAFLLLVVGFGRVGHGRQLVDEAAAEAARAASLASNPAAAVIAGEQGASRTLDQAGVSCTGMRVAIDTSGFGAGGEVTATVRCTADLSTLAIAGLPGSMTLESSSRAPLEPFRDFGS